MVTSLKNILNRLYAVVLLSVLLPAALLSACGKSEPIPDPPHVKAQLITELFSSLRNENYEMAHVKIQRLKEIDDDMSLGGIEDTINNNIVISQAQAALDKGDINGALKAVAAYMDKNGQTSSMLAAQKELQGLKLVQTSIDEIQKADDSKNLAISTGKLNKMITADPSLGDLKQYADMNLQKARELREMEISMAIEDLKADIDLAWVNGNSNIDSLMAMLTVSRPGDNIVAAYESCMADSWQNIPYDRFNPDMALLYFRQAMNSPSKLAKNNELEKVGMIPPGSLSSMLMQAIIMNMSGNTAGANELFEDIKDNVSVSDKIQESWINFVPAVSANSMKTLNPFVLYPFYAYFTQK